MGSSLSREHCEVCSDLANRASMDLANCNCRIGGGKSYSYLICGRRDTHPNEVLGGYLNKKKPIIKHCTFAIYPLAPNF